MKLRRIRTVFGAVATALVTVSASAQPAAPSGSAPPDTPPVSTPDATPPPPVPAPAPAPAPVPAPAPAPAQYPYGNAPYSAPAYTPYAYSPPPTPEPKRDPRVADANADRVVIVPTAYTHPAGTVYLSSSEIVLLQVGYALSDTTQITLTGTPPLEGPNKIFLFDLSLKSAFVRQGPLRIAGIGSVSGLFGDIDQGNLVLGRVGGVAQLCFDDACESSVSLASNVLLAGPATFMVGGVGGIWRVADWAALLLEVDTFTPLGNQIAEYSGVAVIPGFRFPYKNWALDLAAARALDTKNPPDPVLIPWVSFTYRFLP